MNDYLNVLIRMKEFIQTKFSENTTKETKIFFYEYLFNCRPMGSRALYNFDAKKSIVLYCLKTLYKEKQKVFF